MFREMLYIMNLSVKPENAKKVIDVLYDKVLGLDIQNAEKYIKEQEQIELPEEIKELIEKRKQARENKDWIESDRIRDILKEKGYQIKDTKEGMSVELI